MVGFMPHQHGTAQSSVEDTFVSVNCMASNKRTKHAGMNVNYCFILVTCDDI